MANADRSAEQFRKMTETPIPKLILSLAAPTILSMLITSIYNLADTFFCGPDLHQRIRRGGHRFQPDGHSPGAGLHAGPRLRQHHQPQPGQPEHRCLPPGFASTSFFTALVFGGIITVAGLLTLPGFMMLLGSTETILPHACAYARYILLAAPIMMSSLVMNNILRYEARRTLP